MDHNTLWFIANGMERPVGLPGPRPYKSGPSPAAPPRPCFNCGGDHWVRDCTFPRKERLIAPGPPIVPSLPPLIRHCVDCGVKHFIQDCSMNSENKGKATLNCIQTIPLSSAPSSSESDIVIPLQIITCAQAQVKNKDKQENETETTPSENSKKTKET